MSNCLVNEGVGERIDTTRVRCCELSLPVACLSIEPSAPIYLVLSSDHLASGQTTFILSLQCIVSGQTEVSDHLGALASESGQRARQQTGVETVQG